MFHDVCSSPATDSLLGTSGIFISAAISWDVSWTSLTTGSGLITGTGSDTGFDMGSGTGSTTATGSGAELNMD